MIQPHPEAATQWQNTQMEGILKAVIRSGDGFRSETDIYFAAAREAYFFFGASLAKIPIHHRIAAWAFRCSLMRSPGPDVCGFQRTVPVP